MPEPILQYDATSIPAGYDRARDHGPEVLALWMKAVAAQTHGRAIETILDLGCGTGRFTNSLATHFNASVVGIDPSTRMITQAKAKPHGPRVAWCLARGEQIPLPDDCCDLIYMSMVYHHFVEPDRVASECRRVLRAGGVAFMRTGTAEQADAYPYVPFFPTSVPLLHDILPAASAIRGVFEAAGFRSSQDIVVQEIAATYAQYADKLEAGGDSVLVRLKPADFEAGLSGLRAFARDVDPRPVREPIDCFTFE
jgi:ubiquinone/menaquinone biosynthesis C-methylase UbiE